VACEGSGELSGDSPLQGESHPASRPTPSQNKGFLSSLKRGFEGTAQVRWGLTRVASRVDCHRQIKFLRRRHVRRRQVLLYALVSRAASGTVSRTLALS
jgi:hypothetical protein